MQRKLLMTHHTIPVYTISLPEYTVDKEPDYQAIGSKLDHLLHTHFPNRWLALRAIGLRDHPGRSLEELVSIILTTGTDRYDPNRLGVHADYYRNFTIDLHASPCFFTEQAPIGDSGMADAISHFYGGTMADRGYPIRLDLLMLYDLDQLAPVAIKWTPEGPQPSDVPPPPTESFEFTFRYPDRKQQALVGIVKILR